MYYKKDCKKTKKYKPYHDESCCNSSHANHHQDDDYDYDDYDHDHFGKKVVDFDFLQPPGSISVSTTATNTNPEKVVGELELKELEKGDLVWLSGSTTLIVTPDFSGTINNVVLTIRKAEGNNQNPLQATPIYSITIPPAGSIPDVDSFFFVPLDFVDSSNKTSCDVKYILTIQANQNTAGTAFTATITNTTLTATQYR